MVKANLNLVTFKRTDSMSQELEDITKEFADHFKVKRPYVPDFCRLIMTSKRWSISNLAQKLSDWSVIFGSISGRNKMVKLVQRAFGLCKSDEDINNLRGALLEALVIAGHGGASILSMSNYGWGAQVIVNDSGNSKVVKYECPTPTVPPDFSCKRRSTVDFGMWNGWSGKFYECKVQPASIGCKEIKYMDALSQELSSSGISYEMFFVCAESEEAVKMRLAEQGASSVYKALGYRELTGMLPA